MSITYRKNNLLNDDAESLVIPVNCFGVAGAGLALEAKRRLPGWYGDYFEACKHRGSIYPSLRPGQVHAYVDSVPRRIYSIATKDHWRNPSHLIWIEDGLNNLNQRVHADGVRSIALPAIGCGLGGLAWRDVKPLIERYMDIAGVDARVYEPGATL